MIPKEQIDAERQRLQGEIAYFKAEIYDREHALEVLDTMAATTPTETSEQEVARLLARLEELGYRQADVEK